jgi:hypothetical protein
MEREYSGSRVLAAFVAFQVGWWGSFILHDALDNSADRVRDTQIYNGQIHDQLAHSYDTIGGLVLANSDNDHTFTFRSTDEAGTPETCTGNYEVHADTAAAVGSIACTQTMPASK